MPAWASCYWPLAAADARGSSLRWTTTARPAGDKPPGELCSHDGYFVATDDCDETSACGNIVELDGELVGICYEFCQGTADDPECPAGASYLDSGGWVHGLCIPGCDPVAQDCTAEFGLACYWGYGFECLFANENIPPGEPCGFQNDCASGLVCLSAELLPDCAGWTCCSPFCDLGLGDAQCDVVPGTVCVPFFELGMAPPGYDHVGVCILP